MRSKSEFRRLPPSPTTLIVYVLSVVNSILEAAATGIKTNSTEDNIDDQDTFKELVSQTATVVCYRS